MSIVETNETQRQKLKTATGMSVTAKLISKTDKYIKNWNDWLCLWAAAAARMRAHYCNLPFGQMDELMHLINVLKAFYLYFLRHRLNGARATGKCYCSVFSETNRKTKRSLVDSREHDNGKRQSSVIIAWAGRFICKMILLWWLLTEQQSQFEKKRDWITKTKCCYDDKRLFNSTQFKNCIQR